MSKNTVKNFLTNLFVRQQRKISFRTSFISGGKGFLAISILSAVGFYADVPLIVAPFGATCILIFSSPQDEYSQPINVVGGYMVASIISVIMLNILPHEWWVLGFIVGLTICSMAILRITHPPAGAIPLLIFLYDIDWVEFLFDQMFLGSLSLVAIAIILHKIPPAKEYPKKINK